VLPWAERRRRWSWKEKAQIVAESLAPHAVASAIARRYGLHRNQLYAWRKELRAAAGRAPSADGAETLDFVPVVVSEEPPVAGGPAIEIELAGARVRVSPGVDPALLAAVLRTLKALG
jgi:transposase